MSNIIFSNLSISFEHHSKVVEDINLEFEAGKVTGILGESGSGKSVLVMSILQLLSPIANVSGSIFYKNRNLLQLSEKEMNQIRGNEIALIPQNPMESLNPVLKVDIQLREILNQHQSELDRQSQTELIEKQLKMVGFEHPQEIMEAYPMELSGGMMQRVISLFGSLANPDWIIADEPSKGLDAILRKQIIETFTTISQTTTKNMIIITHDLQLAYHLCDEIIIMRKGKIIESGKTRDVFLNPKDEYTRKFVNSSPSKIFN